MVLTVLTILTVLFGLSTGVPSAVGAEKQVLVNGLALRATEIQRIERMHNVRVESGRYWYDNLSGLWGKDGQPVAGQISPGLNLGGPLKPNASAGNSGIFINGRQIPLVEVQYLQRLLPVMPGRYWMNAKGIGGPEGGPPSFDLAAAASQHGGGGYGGWNKNTPFGNLGETEIAPILAIRTAVV